MRMDELMLLKGVKDDIIEERRKAEEDAQEDAKGKAPNVSKFTSGQNVNSTISSLASKYGLPSGSLPRISMPSLSGL